MTVACAPVAYLDALRRLPIIGADALLAGRHLVVVAPHPDDESLGLGGLIALAQRAGSGVTVIFLTDGEGSHTGSPTFPPARLAEVRRGEAIDALRVLGVPATAVHFLGLGDTALPGLAEEKRRDAMQRIQSCIPPGDALLCVTAPTDPHGDHQAASRLVRDIRWPAHVAVMHYPVWTWMAAPSTLPDTVPTGYRVDIAPVLSLKRKAVACHRSQHGLVVHDAREAFILDPVFVERLSGPVETLLWPT